MTTGTESEALGWGRRRLTAALVAAVAAALVLVAGLGYAVHSALADRPAAARDRWAGIPLGPQPDRGEADRDAIAAAPMLQVAPQDARHGTPAAAPAPSILIPTARTGGVAEVSTGFPRTPEGAIGQLAAIETTVLEGMSIARAGAVYAAWALAGGVGAARWELTADVQAFLDSTAASQVPTASSTVVATPVGAQVKGTDGDAWTVACVLMDVRAVAVTVAEIGYGYCERMQWVGAADGRWMIAPGTPPAHAPSTWPGSELSIRAGWRAWAEQGEE